LDAEAEFDGELPVPAVVDGVPLAEVALAGRPIEAIEVLVLC
jgi:hypothetical protein